MFMAVARVFLRMRCYAWFQRKLCALRLGPLLFIICVPCSILCRSFSLSAQVGWVTMPADNDLFSGGVWPGLKQLIA